MEMEFLRKLPTPQELKEQHPVSAQIVATKTKRDDEIRNIFEGKSDKLILVIGPCSADNEDAVIDYISRLRTVQELSLIHICPATSATPILSSQRFGRAL